MRLHNIPTFAALLAGAAAMPVFAAEPAAATTPQARYEQERAACLNGKSQQDQATCLKEAGAALDQSKRGQLADTGGYKQNATVRCNNLPEKDRADCIARIGGDGTTTSGSVNAGGVLRERVTTQPASAAKP